MLGSFGGHGRWTNSRPILSPVWISSLTVLRTRSSVKWLRDPRALSGPFPQRPQAELGGSSLWRGRLAKGGMFTGIFTGMDGGPDDLRW